MENNPQFAFHKKRNVKNEMTFRFLQKPLIYFLER